MAQVVYYATDESKYLSLKNLCGSLSIEVVRLTANDIKKTVADVIGMSGFFGEVKRAEAEIPPMYCQPEIMIMNGFKGNQLDLFLGKLKTSDVSKIDLKAIVTPYNMRWSIYELTLELIKEKNEIG